MNQHTETIECPECETIQEAEVEHSFPWYTYIHTCETCGYVIMESEWKVVEKTITKHKCQSCGVEVEKENTACETCCVRGTNTGHSFKLD